MLVTTYKTRNTRDHNSGVEKASTDPAALEDGGQTCGILKFAVDSYGLYSILTSDRRQYLQRSWNNLPDDYRGPDQLIYTTAQYESLLMCNLNSLSLPQ
jgi:hypothetical protein